MRDIWGSAAIVAAWGVLFVSEVAVGAVYKTPTRQKVAQSRAPASRVVPASKGQAVATRAKSVAQPAQVKQSAKPSYVAKTATQASSTSVVHKSNDLLALEALERTPPPVASNRAPASAAKPTAPRRSNDSVALDALVGSP